MFKLYMFLIGCTPAGRHIEQHDMFFGIGRSVRELLPDIIAFWPEAKGRIHLDAWREVTKVDGFAVRVVEKPATGSATQLFFINLGGYKPNEFEEFHYKMLVAAPEKGTAIRQAKETAFFRHTNFPGANSHIDDKYGLDVDDVFDIEDILPSAAKNQFSLLIEPAPPGQAEDELHLGYFKLDAVDKWYKP
jgi:hypothetical protein